MADQLPGSFRSPEDVRDGLADFFADHHPLPDKIEVRIVREADQLTVGRIAGWTELGYTDDGGKVYWRPAPRPEAGG
jgi:hypothetical protein